ncbi:MAG: alpha/beta hydrolase [Burkholderiales bacterium]
MSEPLECIEIETAASPTAAVIWLHGLGADGNDFAPIVPELDLANLPVRFIFPHAPRKAVTINNGMVMRAWYDISDAAIRREDESGVRASQGSINALIDKERGRGIACEKIVLAGFSQGGAIALHSGLRYAEALAGVMALSCYLPLADKFALEAAKANQSTSIFMGHGLADPVVTHARALESREILRTNGYQIEWHEYRMPHSVCAEEVADISMWLRQVLSA